MARLEHRIQDIEASLRRLERNQNNDSSSGPSEPVQPSVSKEDDVHVPDDGVSIPTPPKSDVLTRSNHATHDRAEFGEIDVSENPIDGMGAINFTDEEDCGFFGKYYRCHPALGHVRKMTELALGPSSNIAFLRHISRAIARGNARTPGVPSLSSPSRLSGGMLNVSRSRPSNDLRSRMQAPSKNEVNILDLPSEDRTWNLIQIYFEKTGQLLPFIHEASFCETYFRMRADNFKRVRRTWLGLLNIVLAIATSLHTEGDLPTGRRIEESDVYFQRANGLCDRDSKRNATLEMGINAITDFFTGMH